MMRLDHTPPKGAGKVHGVTKTERLLQIVEGMGQDKVSFLPLGIRTAELADRAGVPRNSVQALLAAFVASGRVRCCKVTVPGSPPQNEYRVGAGVPAPEFKPLNTRRGPGSLVVARNGVTTAAVPVSTPRPALNDIATPTLTSKPQPEVGAAAAATPAAGGAAHPPPVVPAVAAKATPRPATGAALKKEPATRKASAGDDVRIGINCDGVMVIALDDGSIELNPKQARKLGHFMRGTQGVWNPF